MFGCLSALTKQEQKNEQFAYELTAEPKSPFTDGKIRKSVKANL